MQRFPSCPCCSRVMVFAVVCVGLVFSDRAQAQAPLHERIDQLIAASKPDFEKQAAPIASDAEFLRRVSLDLTGIIPSADEARTFLQDAAADRRGKLVDRLLAAENY